MNYDPIHSLIESVARADGVAPEDVYASIQEAIDAAWADDSIQHAAFRRLLFGVRKPTVEDFLSILIQQSLGDTFSQIDSAGVQ